MPLSRILAHVFTTQERTAWQGLDVPADREAAYRVQQQMLARMGTSIAGWKVGTAPLPDAVWSAPLPQPCVLESPARAQLARHPVCGLELELAFRFDREFSPAILSQTDEEILEALAFMALALEVVSTRYLGWPDVPDLLKLADLQNHGLLVVGEAVPYDPGFPFLAPTLSLQVNGIEVARQPGGNPAGDPRRLLPPLVRQCVERGVSITPHHWITTGSYSGICFVDAPAHCTGHMEQLPALALSLS